MTISRKRTIVFGGFDERYKYLSDVWAWDGKSWVRVAEGGPPARSHHSMAFDPQSGSIVVFGGLRNGRIAEPLGDTWILTGSQWRSVPTTGPAPRSGHLMAYDPVRKSVVLYGGSSWDGKASTHYRDTWAWDGSRWTRIN